MPMYVHTRGGVRASFWVGKAKSEPSFCKLNKLTVKNPYAGVVER